MSFCLAMSDRCSVFLSSSFLRFSPKKMRVRSTHSTRPLTRATSTSHANGITPASPALVTITISLLRSLIQVIIFFIFRHFLFIFPNFSFEFSDLSVNFSSFFKFLFDFSLKFSHFSVNFSSFFKFLQIFHRNVLIFQSFFQVFLIFIRFF